jgi:hypothetical protein
MGSYSFSHPREFYVESLSYVVPCCEICFKLDRANATS